MSFAADVDKEERGVLFRLDVSFDGWLSTWGRLTNRWYEDSAPRPEARILSLGQLTHALAEDRSLAPRRLDVVLANLDGALDSFMGEGALALRFRLYLGLYTFGEAQAAVTLTWKSLGEYLVAGQPRRTATTLSLGLEGVLVQGAVRTPTLEDWYTQDAQCPLRWLDAADRAALEVSPVWTRPLPLVFGDEAAPLVLPPITDTVFRGGGGVTNDGGFLPADLYFDNMAWPICATSSASLVGDSAQLWIQQVEDPNGTLAYTNNETAFQVPRTFAIGGGVTWNIWTEKRGQLLTVDGREWYVRFLLVSVLGLHTYIRFRRLAGGAQIADAAGWTYPGGQYLNAKAEAAQVAPNFRHYVASTVTPGVRQYVLDARLRNGANLSHVTTLQAQQLPVDILADLASYGLVPALDATMAAKLADDMSGVDTSLGGFLRVEPGDGEGNAGGGEGVLDGDGLQALLTEFADSLDFDAFVRLDNALGVVADVPFVGDASALVTFDSEELSDVQDRVPSREERGAYYNRLALDDTTYDREGILAAIFGQPLKGPFDNPDAGTPVSVRALQRRVSSRWMQRERLKRSPWLPDQVGFPTGRYFLSSALRRRLTFTVGLRGLLLELGDYFRVTWTRGYGLGDIYSQAIFVAIGLTFDFETLAVTVTGLEALPSP